jgi:hypothetical protein
LAYWTLPTLSENTNVEPGRSILVAFLLLCTPLLIMLASLFYIKAQQLFVWSDPDVLPEEKQELYNMTMAWQKTNRYHFWLFVVSVLILTCGAQVPLGQYEYIHKTSVSIGFLGILVSCCFMHSLISNCIPNALERKGYYLKQGNNNTQCTDYIGFDIYDSSYLHNIRKSLLVVLVLCTLSTFLFGLLGSLMEDGTQTADTYNFLALPLSEYLLFIFLVAFGICVLRSFAEMKMKIAWPRFNDHYPRRSNRG